MPAITLTFDNGPTPGVTDAVLDVLHERGLRATFFLIGEKLRTPERRALAERARVEGHWLGNHTMTHGEPLGLLDDPRRETAEISGAQEVLADLSAPERFFRPTGHGRIGPHLLGRAAADLLTSGGYTMVLWSLFVRDSKMPGGWAERALNRLPDRDWHVLVLHDLPSGAMAALPRFLDAVDALGYEVRQDFPPDMLPISRGTPAAGFDDAYVTSRVSGRVAGGR
jgi:peptidoglycan/xylan/chitin deacetylase (PgdA/CDA1 family)